MQVFWFQACRSKSNWKLRKIPKRNSFADLLRGQGQTGAGCAESSGESAVLHPKISGLCLLPASYEEWTSAWYDHVQWKQMHLVPDIYRCSKWLNIILAWHFFGNLIAGESFSGADAVPGFYGKLGGAYGLQKRNNLWTVERLKKCRLPVSADVCG